MDPDHPAYSDFLYWWYWASGTFQPALTRKMAAQSTDTDQDNVYAKIANQRFEGGLRALDERLAVNEWLAGSEFTVADIMVVFSLTTMRYFCTYSLDGYGNILGYLERIGEREAYKRAMRKSDPDLGLILGPDSPKRYT